MRSRWIFLALALATAAICARLGLWQLGRHLTRKQANGTASIARQMGFRPYPDSAVLAPDVGIVMRGTFDHARDIVLRGRAHDGAPGVEIATPFRVTGTEQAIVVLRGFVPSDDAMSVDLGALHEPGEQTVRGFLFPVPMQGTPIVREGATTWDRIPGAWLKVNLPYPVAGYALWQEKDSGMPGMPIRLGAPALSEGPHFNYAVQWFGFAIIFAGGGIAYTFRRKTEE
jgi:surfeit locus 1 family protein